MNTTGPVRPLPDQPSWVGHTPDAQYSTKNATMTGGNTPTNARVRKTATQEHRRESVPNGTPAEVLEWTGAGDLPRLRAALAAENNKQEPRAQLVDELNRRVQAAESVQQSRQ